MVLPLHHHWNQPSWSNLLHLLFLGRSFKHIMCLTDHVQLQECPPWALWGSLSSTIFMFLISIWIFKVNFCRVALQCCATFHCAAKWSATCGQASSLLWIPFPLRSPQSTESCSLSCAAGPCQFPMLCICRPQPPHSSQTPLLPTYP